MKKIYMILGKSSVGKDTVYRELMKKKNFQKIIPYTTRPVRQGEVDGREYYFIDEEGYSKLKEENKIIEERAYQTVYGIWRYLTADDGQFQKEEKEYLLIGTLESFQKIKKYFDNDVVLPIYIVVNDRERLLRSIKRESRQKKPGYAEVCRRFLEDEKDFSEEKLREAGVKTRFENNNLKETVDKILKYMETTR